MQNKGIYSISIRPESLIEDTKIISSEEGTVISIDTLADRIDKIDRTNNKTNYKEKQKEPSR